MTITAQKPIFTNVGSGFDISTAVYSGDEGILDVADEEGGPYSLTFSSDGLKLFVFGSLDNYIVEYDLSNPYDITTAVYTGASEEFYIGYVGAAEIVFNPAGTKLFVTNQTSKSAMEYDLSASFDVSSAVYAGESEELYYGDVASNGVYLKFNNDGSKLFLSNGLTIYTYNLLIDFDISSGEYAGTEETLLLNETPFNATSFNFNNDGTKLFTTGNAKAIIGYTLDGIGEYDLTEPYNVGSAIYTRTVVDLNEHNIYPAGLTFNDSGTKVFIVSVQGGAILEYNLASTIYYNENESSEVIDCDANDGMGGPTDYSVSYSLTGDDAGSFTIDDDGIITFISIPNYEDPQDFNADGVYEFTLVASGVEDSYQRFNVHLADVADTPEITDLGAKYDISASDFADADEILNVAFEEYGPREITFNNDGSKLYILGWGSETIIEYALPRAYEVSSADYLGTFYEFDVSSEEATPTAMLFNDLGTKLYVLGTSGDAVVEYDLSEPFKVSSASYSGSSEELYIGNEDGLAYDMSFNDDGTKLFILGSSNDAIIEYQLSEAYDVSTAVHSGQNEHLNLEVLSTTPVGMVFSDDGSQLFILEGDSETLLSFNLTQAFDISTAEYAGIANTLSLRGSYYQQNPTAIAFDNLGTRLFVIGNKYKSVFRYELVPTISFLENNTSSITDINANDGLGGENDTDVVYSLEGDDKDLFTIDEFGTIAFKSSPDYENPLDLNTDNSYEITVVVSNSIDKSEASMRIVVKDVADNPVFVNVGNGFDVSTSEHAGEAQENYIGGLLLRIIAMTMNEDGTRLYILDGRENQIVSFHLSTAFDISTAQYFGENEVLYVGGEETNPSGIALNQDGTQLYVIGENDDAIVVYTLSTPFDLSTATYAGASEELSVGSEESEPTGIAFNNDGSKLYVVGQVSDAVNEYDLATPFQVSSATFLGVSETLLVRSEESRVEGMAFSNDGNRLFIVGSSQETIFAYDLLIPFDVSTASYEGIDKSLVLNRIARPFDVLFNDSGSKLIVSDWASENLVEYRLASSIEFLENLSTSVIDIDANDGMGGENDISVTYSLSGVDADLFDVDNEGVITFFETPDFENPSDIDFDNLYQFEVVATNNFGSTIQQVRVTVQDENDTPVFAAFGMGFDVSTGVHAGETEEFNIPTMQDYLTEDLIFSADGTQLFILGRADKAILYYDLLVPFDVSTVVYAGEDEELYIGDVESDPRGISFDNSGMKLFVIGTSKDAVIEYSMTTPYDISSAVYTGVDEELYIGNNESYPQGIAFSPDGSKLFITGSAGDAVIQYSLEISYDVSSADPDIERYSIQYQTSSPTDIALSSDGHRLFIMESYSRSIIEYSMDEAFDLTSIEYAGDAERLYVSDQELQPRGMTFNDNGLKLFILGLYDDSIVEYDLVPVFHTNENETQSFDIDANDGVGGDTDVSVSYTLEDGDGSYFEIDEHGMLAFLSQPDFEEPLDSNFDNIYELTLTASSTSGETSIAVNVVVMDVDDTPPSFISPNAISISENTEGFIYTLEADELVFYTMGSSQDEALFNLTVDKLSFIEAPDYENPQDVNTDNSYQLTVIATDLAGNSSEMELTITITDIVDETPPSFISPNSISVNENTEGIIYTLETDEEAFYEIGSSQDEALFNLTIDELSFIEAPDYENPKDGNGDNSYQLTVKATDLTGNTSEMELTITITDVADEMPPTFISSSSISIDEGTEGFIYTLEADEQVSYELGSSQDEGLFNLSIDKLSFKAAPDYENPKDRNKDNRYKLTVTAIDLAGNSSEMQLTIVVLKIEEPLAVIEEDQLIAYPNPSKNYFKIETSSIYERVVLYNLAGEIISVFEPSKNHVYSLKGIASGFYVISIEDDSGKKDAQFRIQKLD